MHRKFKNLSENLYSVSIGIGLFTAVYVPFFLMTRFLGLQSRFGGNPLKSQVTCLQIETAVLIKALKGAVIPFRTAVPFWGQTILIISSLSPKRDCGSRRYLFSCDWPWLHPSPGSWVCHSVGNAQIIRCAALFLSRASQPLKTPPPCGFFHIAGWRWCIVPPAFSTLLTGNHSK